MNAESWVERSPVFMNTPPDSPGTVNEHALNVSLVNIVNTVYDLHEHKR